MVKQNAFGVGLVGLFILQGCFFPPKAVSPIPATWDGAIATGDRLMLLLPGMGDRLGVFEREGFQAAARQFPALMDKVVLVELDAHFGYYPKGEIVRRVKQDILDRYPDHQVSIVGTSLGGFGAQVIARNFPERVDQLILIAPFMGGRKLIRRIAEEGLAPKSNDSAVDREALLNWQYILDVPTRGRPDITILVGESDRLKRGLEVLANKAPSIQITTLPGGHKWDVWQKLWLKWLEAEAAQID